MVWFSLLTLGLAVGLAVRLNALKYRWRWAELSLEARLREAETRAEVVEKVLARLKNDLAAGKLTINDEYRSLFERLTSEIRSESPGGA
ncbi:MAG: hypothetical protein HYU66_02785 [Armatimonadetes bacterium]|nr:hypothetical protein [Armatimonadota bacterium]